MSNDIALSNAMAFYHGKGFVPAHRQAIKFAGAKGHVGTLLDVIDARLVTPPKSVIGYDPNDLTPWDQYYTTMSAEYLGFSKTGRKILIVAHGVGPMATEKGVVAAYKHEFGDKSRNRRGGRISAEEFHKLESGHYGPVEIVDFDDYIRNRKYPFASILRGLQALKDPVLHARLGPKTDEYLMQHTKLAFAYYDQAHANDQVINPYIIKVDDANNCSYIYRQIEEGYAFAHLLSIGQINHVHHSNARLPAWSCDISCHEWTDGTRLIGVRGDEVRNILQGPDAHTLLRDKWRELMEPSGLTSSPRDFYVLMQLKDETWFTQVDKEGDGMDTGAPEFLVTSIEKIGEPVPFSTDVRHYYMFFKYDMCEARAVLSPEANAYALAGEPDNVWEGGNPVRQTCLVQGYRIKIDHTRRIVRKDKLANDYNRMMELLKAI